VGVRSKQPDGLGHEEGKGPEFRDYSYFGDRPYNSEPVMGDKTITKSKRVEGETALLEWGREAAINSLGVGNSISPANLTDLSRNKTR
jgi:hypothetical protein